MVSAPSTMLDGSVSDAAERGASASLRSPALRRATSSSGTTSTSTPYLDLFRRRRFPGGDPTSQLMSTAGIFAVGFFMRPLGGWLFGWIADRTVARTRWWSPCS